MGPWNGPFQGPYDLSFNRFKILFPKKHPNIALHDIFFAIFLRSFIISYPMNYYYVWSTRTREYIHKTHQWKAFTSSLMSTSWGVGERLLNFKKHEPTHKTWILVEWNFNNPFGNQVADFHGPLLSTLADEAQSWSSKSTSPCFMHQSGFSCILIFWGISKDIKHGMTTRYGRKHRVWLKGGSAS